MIIIQNLIVPLLIVLVLYAIPVVPTWRALKRKKVSFGVFLGWIVGEVFLVNILLYILSLMVDLNKQYQLEAKYNLDLFELLIFAIFISALFFIFLPFIIRTLLFKNESLKKANLYAFGFILIPIFEATIIMYTIAIGIGRLGD